MRDSTDLAAAPSGELRRRGPQAHYACDGGTGAAGLLDIFRNGARQREPGTPEDDAEALRGDVKRIAQDFHAVLFSIEPTPKG